MRVRLWWFLVLCQAFVFFLKADPVAVPAVLRLGPINVDCAMDETTRTKELGKILVDRLCHAGLPSSGQKIHFFDKTQEWEMVDGAFQVKGMVEGEIQAISFNLESDRFLPGKFALNWDGKIRFFLDGIEISGSSEKGFDVSLCSGSHRVIVLLWGESKSKEKLGLTFESDHGVPDFHLAPTHRVSARLLFHTPRVGSVRVSPDGRWAAIGTRGYDEIGKKWDSSLEIRSLADGQIQRQWFGDGCPSNLVWSPCGSSMSYVLDSNLLVEPAMGGEARRLVAGAKGIGSLKWNRDGKSLFFSWETQDKKRDDGVKRYRALEDRWTNWRNLRQIFQVDLQSGVVRQLTHGSVSHRLLDVHPSGKRLLITSNPVDYGQPPYTKTYLQELSLDSGKLGDLGTFWNFNNAAYALDGLYVLGGPSLFDGLGKSPDLKGDPNEYDGQLYFLNPQTGDAQALSRDFEPGISSIQVLSNGDLLLKVSQRQHVPLYWYRAKTKRFEKVPSPASVVDSFDCAYDQPHALCWAGSSAATSQKVYSFKDPKGQPQVFFDPAGSAYAKVELGGVKPFVFTNSEGTEIDGRFYTPPDFDPEKKYPLIVYYYGGTSTVEENFTGRYPFHLWAAHGYLIYVMQPSGTVGYGQEFSARHVNAWGRYTADDIIESTRAFVKQHPFVDGESVGCAGASYGGFMTMYLLTRTDMFSAAISHAGISTLSGYWGKGWWGYLYSGVASKESFPWNNKDLYVDQSPVFAADRITTPLLLLHGDADTNVPPEQSHTMFTALKMLGKDVELIEILGENHHIMEHDKRLIWWDTFLAYFDKHLKGQETWWKKLYPSSASDDEKEN